MADTVSDPVQLLSRFGLTCFRPGQREVIDAVLGGRDVLCVMPTGGGKSLCYQLPSLARGGTTIVVSPLIALMKDQIDTLRGHGINARLINSSLTLGEQESVMREMSEGTVPMVYVAPERLRNGRFLEAVAKANLQPGDKLTVKPAKSGAVLAKNDTPIAFLVTPENAKLSHSHELAR